ncbi:MAG TPA: hypothetical protein PK711_09525 [Bacteroidales bacterium]|nr:hypothetical protein [Bacteroidales bacterium]
MFKRMLKVASTPAGLVIVVLFLSCFVASAQKKEKDAGNDTIKSSLFGGLKFRSIGPAFTSGRIADFAVNPDHHSEYFVAVGSGNIWKTVNNGTTFDPVFDNYGAYAIGCLAMDPSNHSIIWAGTGENNHQRSLGYGDGVYKSIDGGKSWKHMGLKESRQIGKIIIHPRNSNTVYVAAEGSVWGPGGDRGLFQTRDSGKTWEKILSVSENTGINDMVMDPRDPDIMYASSEQRRRHVYTKIGGGPETAIYKTTDGGKTWDKLTSGLPSADMGGIGLAISPVNPDVIYAIIEAAEDQGGFYRSRNRGATWEKMSDHHEAGQYYNEIYCDPKDVDKVYSVETISHVTHDGGKTWQRIGLNNRHVDDHALWIDPEDTRHFMIGGDGGIYETFDDGMNYIFKSNLPVTQFYRLNVDNQYPFYHVYGGTQDNGSMGGPSGNTSRDGVSSAEWYITNGGDGFWTAVDPVNTDIIYAESQYGNMVRYDRKSGESISIRPEPRKGENTYQWNWNTPLLISPHSPTRLYCSANKVFRSDDRGDSWTVISEDLTRQIDRNTFQVMGKYWSIDAVAKDRSTSLYGTIISLDESPVKENLIYAGTDDGLIQVTEDGKNWRRIEAFPGVPEYTYVSDLLASLFDENVVFASFDNILRDDFKPYLLKSIDKGHTWTSIAGDLPQNGTVHTIVQDHVNPDLLFCGTEFGVFFTYNGGGNWIQLKSGIPTISVRDMVIQKRENDLVLATFGRGFYILDDYSPLREFKPEMKDMEGFIFPVKDALMYIQSRGGNESGSTPFIAPHKPFGAVFTYYLKDVPKTKKELRKEKEEELFKKGEKIPIPTDAELIAEREEIPPYLVFTVTDAGNNIVRHIYETPKKGIQRVVWNMRYQGLSPVNVQAGQFDPLDKGGDASLALPGKYHVSLGLVSDDQYRALAGPVAFTASVLENTALPVKDREELAAFRKDVATLNGTMQGAQRSIDELQGRLESIKQAGHITPGIPEDFLARAQMADSKLETCRLMFTGKTDKPSDEENLPGPVPLNQRMGSIVWGQWRSTSVTKSMKDNYAILLEEFPPVLEMIRNVAEKDIRELEDELVRVGAPWTPGRVPVWK